MTQEMTPKEQIDAIYNALERLAEQITKVAQQQIQGFESLNLRLTAIEECIKQMPTQKLD